MGLVSRMLSAWRTVLSKCGYVLLSAGLAFHVFCVFIAPAAMPPSSPLLEDGYRFALPYNQALFLNHGYHYFAPDPGASTLIKYAIPREGDSPLIGRFPTPSLKPRLLYHRYFMLAENLWTVDGGSQTELERAYARHFANLHHSSRIELFRVSHEPSSIVRIQAGGHLDDPEMFEEESLGQFDFSESQDAAGIVAPNSY
jgi:hypothetical protein